MLLKAEPDEDPWNIKAMPPLGPPPTEPIHTCLECGVEFVWWLHPVQLCEACVDIEIAKALEVPHADTD